MGGPRFPPETMLHKTEVEASEIADDPLIGYGDVARVEMGLYLDGEQVGGFSVEFVPSQQQVYLPLIQK